jgi:hypothetical protein
LMREIGRGSTLTQAAMHSNMDRKTARKYRKLGGCPGAPAERSWRIHADAFVARWPDITAFLELMPELEARWLFEWLLEGYPGEYQEGQLRTFQRRIRRWRATRGPAKEVFFSQAHRPGEALQADFTVCNELEITVAGEPFAHMLCHVALPYSNWSWATVCSSESMLALRRGVQAALSMLGSRPEFHQTDNSTAATHRLCATKSKRGFNDEYVGMMKHFGMAPRTTGVGKKDQNGDIESLHGVLKRRLRQCLLLRGGRDLGSIESYEIWVQAAMARSNLGRTKRLNQELAVMRPVVASALPEFRELQTRVTRTSTVRVKSNSYSVPSPLIGETVKVHVYERYVEVYCHGQQQLRCERLIGAGSYRIDYRHVIWSLVRKPGAFHRLVYREVLFPRVVFRRAYDGLTQCWPAHPTTKADRHYLCLLHLAASTLESDVAIMALELLLDEGQVPTADAVKELLDVRRAKVPTLAVAVPDLGAYDALLGSVGL